MQSQKGKNVSIKKRTATNYIVVHCSATRADMDIDIKEIDRWHKERGFEKVGYHDVIKRDGECQVGRERDDMGAHVQGHNHESIGICLVGGVDKKNRPENNFTEKQFASLKRLLRYYRVIYPKALIVGHCQLDSGKACPSFSVPAWLQSVSIL